MPDPSPPPPPPVPPDVFDELLECIGDSCAIVISAIENTINTMLMGRILKVIATDADTEPSVPQWCTTTNNMYIGLSKTQSDQGEDLYNHYIRRM